MKKLFTLFAFLAVFMGAKADWVEDYKIDYSTNTGFPFWVMGYVPEWVDGVMTDYGANYRYETQANLDGDGDGKWKDGEESVGTVTNQGGTEYQKVTGAGPYWHQYFIADGITTEIGGSYHVKAMVKASEEVTINVNMGWGWGAGESVSASVKIGTDWNEVEWDYTDIGGASCNLVAQPGTSTATIEWKSLTVSHNQKPQAAVTWLPVEVSNGDAETAWPAWALEEEGGVNANWRGDKTAQICAWGLTMGRNFDDQCPADISGDSFRARPFPADIVAEPGNESNHVFAVNVTQIGEIDNEASIAWSNQFWIQSPQTFKAGTKVRVSFRYKAEKAASGVASQMHKIYPSIYLNGNGVGTLSFTTEWQPCEKVITWDNDGWSIAFNLTNEFREPNVYYFDDIKFETMKLDEGYFVASANTTTGIEYDFATATEFVEEDGVLVATVGEAGKQDTWVNEVMISTVRGEDSSFRGATLKPQGDYKGEDAWGDYVEASNAKVQLAAGVWKISIDTGSKQMNFVQIEGEAPKEPEDIVTNATEIVVNGQERDWRGKDNEGNLIEEQEGTGQPWDNQFFLVANRTLEAGTVTHLKFKYKASKDAKASTQSHNLPGQYIHWYAIGDVNFTTEWQEFDQDVTVPDQCDGKDNNGYKNDFKSIAFNLAEIKDACKYEIKDVQWYVVGDNDAAGKTQENLINATGAENFYVKEGAGTDPYVFGSKDPVEPNPFDVTGDGKVNGQDIQSVINASVAGTNDPKFDVTGDGKVNGQDIQAIINAAVKQQ